MTVRRAYCSFDNFLGTTMLFVLWMCSLLSALLAPLQTHLLFNEGILHTLEVRRQEIEILRSRGRELELEPAPEPARRRR